MQIGVGGCLKDVHRLHLPALTWRGPLPLHSASVSVQHTAGLSANGLVRAQHSAHDRLCTLQPWHNNC